MATIIQLPSGKWRAQVRRAGVYRNATFPKRRDAQDWAATVETQAHHIAASGFAPVPKDATVADLIDLYAEKYAKEPGKTKAATHVMLKRELGKGRLANLNALVLRDFIDRRVADGAGGVTIAADLSFLSAILKWGRHARQLDIPPRLALDARESLKHRGLVTRSKERRREPTDDELVLLYSYWKANPRQRIDMPVLCRFALATGMRLGGNLPPAGGRRGPRRQERHHPRPKRPAEKARQRSTCPATSAGMGDRRAADRWPGGRQHLPRARRIRVYSVHARLRGTRDSRPALPRSATPGHRGILSRWPGHSARRADDRTQNLDDAAALYRDQACRRARGIRTSSAPSEPLG